MAHNYRLLISRIVMIVSKNRVKSTAIKSILLFLCISINNTYSAEIDEQHQKSRSVVVVASTYCCFWPWSAKIEVAEKPVLTRASVFDLMLASLPGKECIRFDKKEVATLFAKQKKIYATPIENGTSVSASETGKSNEGRTFSGLQKAPFFTNTFSEVCMTNERLGGLFTVSGPEYQSRPESIGSGSRDGQALTGDDLFDNIPMMVESSISGNDCKSYISYSGSY